MVCAPERFEVPSAGLRVALNGCDDASKQRLSAAARRCRKDGEGAIEFTE